MQIVVFQSDVPCSVSTSPFLEHNISETWLLYVLRFMTFLSFTYMDMVLENDKEEGYVGPLVVAGRILQGDVEVDMC